jgi:D-alanyl-D-alanine carboxypeptidase
MARGYRDNDRLIDAADWPAVRPSGAFLSTVLDLAKWEAVLLTDKILSKATREQMWTRVTLEGGSPGDYGFGWHVGSVRGRRTVYHGGGLPGFNAVYQRFVDDRLAIVVLMNTDDGDINSIALGIAALYLPATGPS